MTHPLFAPLHCFARWVVLLAALAVPWGPALAQDPKPFTDAELDQMLAPIALYPDSLLSQVLMASTYPADVKDAAAWSKAHPDAKGDAAVKQVESQPWEPAVQSLVAFPQVLVMMSGQPDQVQKLGDAFLADPGRVMDRVQFLRKKAQDAGNLKTTTEQKVSTTTAESKQVIVIEPAQPQNVYVPVYQPTVVYGPWMYPAYPPTYWPPPPAYYPGAAFAAGVVWGAAVVGVSNALWGGFGWGHNDVNINVNRYNNINVNRPITNNNNTFVHNADRRRDVPYRDSRSREQFGQTQRTGASERNAYRGHDNQLDAERARASETLKSRGADPAAGRERLQGADRDRANQAVRNSERASPGGREGGGAQRPGAGGGGTRDTFGSGSHDNAFSGVRDSGSARADADRGRASRASM
ncbi:MAG: DUF3300 domain-containing protein, partial [Rhizobacter sp.]